jgi:hypothetical protein
MKLLFTCWINSLVWLVPTAATACAVCRPKVQAAIHNADYSVNVALLLLPVALLLAVGVGLYYADALWARVRSGSQPVTAPESSAVPLCL